MNFKVVPLFLLLAACGDDGSPAQPDAGPGSNDAGSDPDPQFLVGTTIFTDSGSTTYFALTPDVGSGELALDTALESPGMAKLYAREGLGWFALGGGEEPTVTRYTISESGQFTAGDTVSFQPRGTTYLGDTTVFVSDTKAYYFDAPNRQLVKWNPEAMTVDGVIDLSMTAKPDVTTIFDVKPLLRADGSLVFAVAWRNFVTDETFPGTGLVVIDTATDSVRKYSESTACQGVTWTASTPDGTLYAATTPYYAVLQRMTGEGPASCVLRLSPTSDEFDASYRRDFSALLGGRVAGGVARGTGGELLFRALNADVTVAPGGDPAAVWSDAVWTWHRWNPADDTVTPVTTLAPSAAGGLTYDIGDHVYATDSAADFSATTLIDLTASGGPREALSSPGYIYGLAKIR